MSQAKHHMAYHMIRSRQDPSQPRNHSVKVYEELFLYFLLTSAL